MTVTKFLCRLFLTAIVLATTYWTSTSGSQNLHTPVYRLYIDPGAGSLIWQMVLSATFSIVFITRKWIRRVFSQILKDKNKAKEEA